MSYMCLNYPKFIFSHNKKIIADNKQQYSQKRLKRDISKPLKTVDNKFSLKKTQAVKNAPAPAMYYSMNYRQQLIQML